MALAYDFDMVSIMPKELQAQFGDMFSELGVADAVKQQRALFRDPATVEALLGASDEVRKCFIASGFSIKTHDSGAGAGCYVQHEEKARMAVLGRLRRNLRELPPDTAWNGFDIRAFIKAAAEARPIGASSQPAAQPPAQVSEDISPQPNQPEASSNGAQSMDAFFAGKGTAAPRPAPAANMEDFFSATPKGAPAPATDPAPDMDAFFSNAPSPRAEAEAPPQMSTEDIRMTIDTPPPKVGFGPMKMGLMVLALFVLVAMLGNSGGANNLVKLATGGEVVSINR